MFKHNPINLNVFDKPLTSEAAYWLGFIMADGCVSRKISSSKKIYPILSVGLIASDSEHLIKLGYFLGSSSAIQFSKRVTNFGPSHSCRLCVSLQGLQVKLAEYGIVARKSWIDLKATIDLKHSPDFWRGILDGDGCISISKENCPFVCLGGSQNLMEDAADFCFSLTGFRPKVSRCRSIYRITVGGLKAIKVLKELYYVNCTALNRKKILALKSIEGR